MRRRRLKVPRYRAPGSSEFKQVSWDFALDRIATLMKQDRDANFIAKNAGGTTVNRWLSTGMLAASAVIERNGLSDMEGRPVARHGGVRQPGACLTRTDGGQSGSNIRSRRNDQHVAGHQECQRGGGHGRQCRRSASVRLQMGDRGEDREQRQAGGRSIRASRAPPRSPTCMRRSVRGPISPS